MDKIDEAALLPVAFTPTPQQVTRAPSLGPSLETAFHGLMATGAFKPGLQDTREGVLVQDRDAV